MATQPTRNPVVNMQGNEINGMPAENSRYAGAVVAVCQEPGLGRNGGVAEPPRGVAPQAQGQVPVKDGLAAVAVHVSVEDLHP